MMTKSNLRRKNSSVYSVTLACLALDERNELIKLMNNNAKKLCLLSCKIHFHY